MLYCTYPGARPIRGRAVLPETAAVIRACDGIGRHARFRFSCSDACGFESLQAHQKRKASAELISPIGTQSEPVGLIAVYGNRVCETSHTLFFSFMTYEKTRGNFPAL